MKRELIAQSNGFAHKIKVGLFEDSDADAKALENVLSRYGNIEVACEAFNGSKALNMAKQVKLDLVFFSLENDRSAMATAQELMHLQDSPLLVLTTRQRQYPIEAFDLDAIDYIIKPFEKERMDQTIRRAAEMVIERQHGTDKDTVKKDRRRYIVCYRPNHMREKILAEASSVEFVQVRHGMVYIHLKDKAEPVMTDWPMKTLLERFNPQVFCQTHKSYLVNVQAAERLVPKQNGNYFIYLRNGSDKPIPLSRRFVKRLRGKMEW